MIRPPSRESKSSRQIPALLIWATETATDQLLSVPTEALG